MEIIKEERDLLKQTQEEKKQKYWALKKQTYEFEAKFATLQQDNNKSRTHCQGIRCGDPKPQIRYSNCCTYEE